MLWFALILVSLKHWKQPYWAFNISCLVVICSHFSIFETLETTRYKVGFASATLWFALILVSLKHWKQHWVKEKQNGQVVICSHFSIFETLETTECVKHLTGKVLWFALILVSLKHWKQRTGFKNQCRNRCDLLSF